MNNLYPNVNIQFAKGLNKESVFVELSTTVQVIRNRKAYLVDVFDKIIIPSRDGMELTRLSSTMSAITSRFLYHCASIQDFFKGSPFVANTSSYYVDLSLGRDKNPSIMFKEKLIKYYKDITVDHSIQQKDLNITTIIFYTPEQLNDFVKIFKEGYIDMDIMIDSFADQLLVLFANEEVENYYKECLSQARKMRSFLLKTVIDFS